ncbi:MAG: hypothetical protein LBD27_00425 [Tannerella sp.]|jgi:hypothetical protein|nr:hypothetical protein [Tannerella sp.]
MQGDAGTHILPSVTILTDCRYAYAMAMAFAGAFVFVFVETHGVRLRRAFSRASLHT